MSVSDSGDLLIIGGKRYWKQSRWSKDKGVTDRTTARHRDKGLPWLHWGGQVYIPEIEGDDYIASRVKRRNSRRHNKVATQEEIAA